MSCVLARGDATYCGSSRAVRYSQRARGSAVPKSPSPRHGASSHVVGGHHHNAQDADSAHTHAQQPIARGWHTHKRTHPRPDSERRRQVDSERVLGAFEWPAPHGHAHAHARTHAGCTCRLHAEWLGRLGSEGPGRDQCGQQSPTSSRREGEACLRLCLYGASASASAVPPPLLLRCL